MRSLNTSWLSGALVVLCSLLMQQDRAAQAGRANTQDFLASDDVVVEWNEMAAAIAAAHGVLKAFFPAAGAVLDGQRDASLALIPGGQIKIDGIAVGEAAAAAMLAERTGDRSAPPQFFLPPSSDPYEWQTTPSCPPAGGAFLHWRHVRRSAS